MNSCWKLLKGNKKRKKSRSLSSINVLFLTALFETTRDILLVA